MTEPTLPAPTLQADLTLQSALGEVGVIRQEPGRVAIEYEVAPHMCHSGGVAQGGFVCGWIDAAMARAQMSLNPDLTPMSLEVKVSFCAPARPGRVIAEAWIERAGRSTSFAEGRLTNLAGDVLAKASSTLRLIPRAAVEASSRKAMG